MKTKLLLSIMFFAFASTNIFGQIPNSGFENWTSSGSYENLNGWGNPNGVCTGTFFPCTKSTDIPISFGTYSIRLENDISLLPSYCALGAASTGSYPNIKFPLTFLPSSVTGYYKFIPQNGDSMTIIVTLYNGASSVSVTGIQTNVAAPTWTSFSVPFPVYSTADSASIALSAYACCPFNHSPHGNSVLYVDNLNFDNLITGISSVKEAGNISIYPNPTSDQFFIEANTTDKLNVDLYDVNGRHVFSKSVSDKSNINVTDLNNGVYTLTIKIVDRVINKKLVIVH